MRRLIRYEFKKLIIKKSLFVILIVFSILNIMVIKNVVEQNSRFSYEIDGLESLYDTMFSEYGGTITLQKVEDILALYGPMAEKIEDLTASTREDDEDTLTGNVYMDAGFVNRAFVVPMEYFYTYNNMSQSIVHDAIINMSFYQEHDNRYEYLRNRYIGILFKGREIEQFASTERFDYYVFYDFSIIVLICIAVYLTASIYAVEHEGEMSQLLGVSRRGRKHVQISKILTILSTMVILSLFFFIEDYIGFSLFIRDYGNSDMPIYALRAFRYTPLRVTLDQYAVIMIVTKTLGVVCISLLLIWVTSFFKNALVPFILNLMICVGLFVVADVFMGTSNNLITCLNPTVLLFTREIYSRTEFVNIMGYPVLTYIAAIVFSIGMSIILVGAILHRSTRNYHMIRAPKTNK